ncbi:MAG: VWA-like domain-containing protein [Bacteroidota bacterium]
MLNRFSQYCQTWIQEAPEWNWWLQQFDRRFSKEIPEGVITAWHLGRPTLLFHPNWLVAISPEDFGLSMEHAIAHFILGHPHQYAVLQKNPVLDHLLDGQVAFHLGHFAGSTQEAFKWAYSISDWDSLSLKADLIQLPASYTAQQAMHAVWLDQMPQEIALHTLFYKQLVGRARRVGQTGFSSPLMAFVEHFITRPKVSWQQVLRRFVWRYGRKVMAYSSRRQSKRYGNYPGIKHRKKGSLLVALDTSGSVKEELLQAFFSELNKLYRLGIRIEVIESDYQIQRKYTYSGTMPRAIAGRGGTDFNPVFRFLQEHSVYDALIYFTDGMAPPPRISTNTPVLWTIFGHQETPLNTWSRFPGQTLMINT